MKKFVLVFALLLLGCCACLSPVVAQVSSDRAVLAWAVVDANKPSITIHWKHAAQTTAQHYNRRVTGTKGWGKSYTIAVTDSSFTDTSVVRGTEYEYQLYTSHTVGGSAIIAYGYLCSGIDVRIGDDPGRCIIVVDTTYAVFFNNKLDRLQNDLLSEGYLSTRINVSEHDNVTDIKHRIDQLYESDPQNISTLFLFGHVPVPYSGFLNPDGHPNHLGAWPADVYYGDDDEYDWTDNIPPTGYDTTGVLLLNQNVEGDGKFDQVQPPSPIQLKIGRVDLSDMPSFASANKMGEKELLSAYLDKDHNYRTGILTAPERGFISDNFGYFGGEAFAASGWRNFSSLIGPDSIHTGDWFTTLDSNAYLFAYGCGGGWPQGASGIGSTTDFANKLSKGIFTLLFGSYFGDWNVPDNFLRAPLASTYGLTCMWSGRPYSLIFPMGMGHTTGDAAQRSQNNTGDYSANLIGDGQGIWLVQVALMGDPTLKMRPFSGPDNVSAVADLANNAFKLTWTKTPGVDGYNVYRASVHANHFDILTPAPLVNIYTFTDKNPLQDSAYYLVRAVRKETTPSGTYINLSNGTWGVSPGFPNAAVALLTGSPESLTVRYNTDDESATILLDVASDTKLSVVITDVEGKQITTIANGNINSGHHEFYWNFANISSGIYLVRAVGSNISHTAKILVLK